ncbi:MULTISPECIES: IS1380 family transposase [unclassified Streptomyces]|uniref:IS1380 family transposase n=1 Tax=unclassified Streptomyces TaxID=2593676 RepID=UPI0022B69F13|nr:MULTISPECIES: IS1380 family transposase [unclassified Streptomyces]MCZ7416997.1 IS1380 family transposase [Streptomyces sp. WMMC897]MCZ7433175.1 IS1380 family transposase [Streptomyces sp. WMMC1477]
MSEFTGWDRRLSVVADGKGLIGHAGAVLLRRLADGTGLTAALAGVLPAGTGTGWRDRAAVVVQLAVAIALGAVNFSDAERLQDHHQGLFGPAVSDSTMRRTLAAMDCELLAKIAHVRARVRRHVWTLLSLRPGGFPWLTIAGKRLHRWVVIDLDATIITAASKKEGARATWKKTYGFHPLAAWCANTGECLAMWLRTGSAGANTVADHLKVLADALAQIPGASTAKNLVRVDGAGATHDLHERLRDLNTRRRTVRFTTGWKITDEDEKAIARLPERAWQTSINQDGSVQEGYFVAELTGLNTRDGWIKGMRLIVRRVKPSARQIKDLTAFEKKTGWKHSIVATNIAKMTRIRGSHQIQWLDVLHRHHAVVEDQVRANKAMGLHNLPSKSWQVNEAWMLTCNLAADLDAWLRLLTLHDCDELADAEPATMRFRLYHLPARLSRHARRRWLRIETTGPGPARSPPHGPGSATSLPSSDEPASAPTKTRTENAAPRDRGTRRSRSDTRRPHPAPSGTNRGEPITSTSSDHR